MCPPQTDDCRGGARGGRSDPKRARTPSGKRVRQLALAMVRELRARGWSYRDIGLAFATEQRSTPGQTQRFLLRLRPARLTHANARRGTAADHLVFLHALDFVSDGLAFFDAAGTLLHTNRALDRMLEHRSETPGLVDEVERFAGQVVARAREPHTGEVAAESVRRELHLPGGACRLRGSYLDLDIFGLRGTVVVAVHQNTEPSATDEALHARFGLSRQERTITRLLARGRSNAEVASALGISPHTARRHTERIFSKLGVRSRAEIARRLQEREEDVTRNR